MEEDANRGETEEYFTIVVVYQRTSATLSTPSLAIAPGPHIWYPDECAPSTGGLQWAFDG